MEQGLSLRRLLDTIINSGLDDWRTIVTWGAYSGPSYRNRFQFYNIYNEQGNVLKHDEHSSVSVYKPNISITIAAGLTINERFEEPWATGFPDRNASSHFIDVFFNNALVFRDMFISVDGGRACLPLPKSKTELFVPKNKVRFVRLIDYIDEGVSDFDSYFSRAGLIETDEEWPVL